MLRSVLARRAARFVAIFPVALAAAAGCGGTIVHLGDGRNDGGGGSGADGSACVHGQVSASEVLWVGDSWIIVPGEQHTRVRDLARAAHAIGSNDDYVIGAVAATTMPMIAGQYDAQETGATKVKVLIEDGGTWETIQAGLAGTSVQDAANGAATAFTQHLAKLASDGTIQHVIYFLPPPLMMITGVAQVGPLMMQACAKSAVPCHFVDLGPLWTNSSYTAANGILPTDAGAIIVGDAIWAVMQQYCIAQ